MGAESVADELMRNAEQISANATELVEHVAESDRKRLLSLSRVIRIASLRKRFIKFEKKIYGLQKKEKCEEKDKI